MGVDGSKDVNGAEDVQDPRLTLLRLAMPVYSLMRQSPIKGLEFLKARPR
jgi:hypothetical protein